MKFIGAMKTDTAKAMHFL